jgi:RNA polymerase sigma factor (sigma-70 family)
MSISEEHLRHVRAIARSYAGLGLDLDDLIQEGSLGLLAAARTYDPAGGVPFTAYARLPIEDAICRALTANSRACVLPLAEPDDGAPDPADRLHDAEARAVLRQAVGELDARWRHVLVLRHGLIDDRPHSLAEVGRALGISRGRVREIETRALNRLACEPRLVALGVALGTRTGGFPDATRGARPQGGAP